MPLYPSGFMRYNMTMNTSPLYRLYKSDIVKGLVTSVLTAIFATIYQYMSVGDFSIFSANWSIIWHASLNVAFIAGFSYLFKNFFTTEDGKVFGKL